MSQVYIIPVGPKSRSDVSRTLKKKGYNDDLPDFKRGFISVGISGNCLGYTCRADLGALFDTCGPYAIIVPHDLVEEKIPPVKVEHTIIIDGKTVTISEESYQSLKAHFVGESA